ncbi:MAG: hypothetical protein M1820_007436 [Bogoriella megaspora]|nr:MAG: hypothetical protein M1820_007436 [Bogoriella megaspora]
MPSISYLSALVATLPLVAGAPHHSRDINATKQWPGWNKLQNFIAFGDSYSQTGFVPTGAQPSAANPLGNPAYPGYTSSNGPNWVDFLTTTYNQSFLKTVNLAYGGATVDASLVTPYQPTVLSFIDQVNTEFIPYYTGANKKVDWASGNTLFGFWFGVNDIGNSYYNNNASINGDVVAVYAQYLDKLYKNGARNFLLLNVPPVNQSPGTTTYGSGAITSEGAAITDFNNKLSAAAKNLSSTYTDTTVFVFDSNTVFSNILSKPSTYPQTAAVKNTTGYCTAYQNGTPAQNTFDPSCGVPVDQYFWLNTLHPTFPVHNATAAQIVKTLGA